MSDEAQKDRHDDPPTYEQLAEALFCSKIHKAIRAWREAGKPHKR